MINTSLTLTTVTPLFMDGATQRDPDTPPELRPASIRGVARYWLRALLGGIVGDQAIDKVSQVETSVFGDTGSASPIAVQLAPKGTIEWKPYIRSSQPIGQDYLFWSLVENRQEPARNAIKPGTEYEVVLTERSGSDGRALNACLVALWLANQLGALGSRARRGAGSFRLSGSPEIEWIPSFGMADGLPDLLAQLQEGIGQIRAQIIQQQQLVTQSVSVPSSFDVLHPTHCQVWILSPSANKGWTSPTSALNAIGEAFRDFRRFTAPHENVAAWQQGQTAPATIARAVFGLPLPYFYKAQNLKPVINGTEHERRASPLHLRITQLGNNQFVGIATLFKSRFLPPNEKLGIEGTRRTTAPPADYSVIEDFIRSSNFTAQEVALK